MCPCVCVRAGHVAAYACVRAQCKEIQKSKKA